MTTFRPPTPLSDLASSPSVAGSGNNFWLWYPYLTVGMKGRPTAAFQAELWTDLGGATGRI